MQPANTSHGLLTTLPIMAPQGNELLDISSFSHEAVDEIMDIISNEKEYPKITAPLDNGTVSTTFSNSLYIIKLGYFNFMLNELKITV